MVQISDKDNHARKLKVAPDGSIPTGQPELSKKLAYSGVLVEYEGVALPGTNIGSTGWQIKKLVYNGNFVTDVLWASSSAKFDKIWTNRASYVYG